MSATDTKIVNNKMAVAADTTISSTTTSSASKTATASSNTLLLSNTKGNNKTSWIVANIVCAALSYTIIQSFYNFRNSNAEEALAFYGVYHRYGWNQVVHFFGVPGIIWSAMIFMVQIPIPFITNTTTTTTTKTASSSAIPDTLNYASFITITYIVFYFGIDPLGAALYSPFLYLMYSSANKMVRNDRRKAMELMMANNNKTNDRNDNSNNSIPWYGTGKTLETALIVQLLCWYVQIHLGHAIVEGAKPALLESLGGAFSVAPLFAFYEGLWYVGINTQLQETTKQLIDLYTKEICSASIDAMKVCATNGI